MGYSSSRRVLRMYVAASVVCCKASGERNAGNAGGVVIRTSVRKPRPRTWEKVAAAQPGPEPRQVVGSGVVRGAG